MDNFFLLQEERRKKLIILILDLISLIGAPENCPRDAHALEQFSSSVQDLLEMVGLIFYRPV
jgi:hypothetical protein